MDLSSGVVIIFGAITVSIFCFVQIHANYLEPKLFNVNSYGAKADGNTDDSKAFLNAWKDACQWKGWSRVMIPRGNYMLNSGSFVGPCNGPISFYIMGIIKAPTDPKLYFDQSWIQFNYVDSLTIEGGGSLDGQGAFAWKYNQCSKNPQQCPPLPISLRFNFVTTATIQHIKSINSKNAHINIFASKNINITNIELTAPGDSPNTDGIKFGSSSNINISHVKISTGDDCIAMLTGTQNIEMLNVSCGPGHGISIGSLGKSLGDYVTGIHLRNSTFSNTQNGVRIKTWSASSNPGHVSDFVCENIFMDNVNNPVVIDQNYCPSTSCDNKDESKVQIGNVTFSNIWGTSSSKVAISLKCSKRFPCENVKLDNINLAYKGRRGHAIASCSNVNGSASGIQLPPGCLKLLEI